MELMAGVEICELIEELKLYYVFRDTDSPLESPGVTVSHLTQTLFFVHSCEIQ